MIVSAAVQDVDANIVIGVNDDCFDLAAEEIVTAASCTTNCLAPVVRVLHDGLGIERGVATTIHNATNLAGGWLGARFGLTRTLFAGLALQIVAVGSLTVPDAWLSVPYVMAAQSLSGVAKDLTKMSSKSYIKLVVSFAFVAVSALLCIPLARSERARLAG